MCPRLLHVRFQVVVQLFSFTGWFGYPSLGTLQHLHDHSAMNIYFNMDCWCNVWVQNLKVSLRAVS